MSKMAKMSGWRAGVPAEKAKIMSCTGMAYVGMAKTLGSSINNENSSWREAISWRRNVK
jgi:hypothetical protein